MTSQLYSGILKKEALTTRWIILDMRIRHWQEETELDQPFPHEDLRSMQCTSIREKTPMWSRIFSIPPIIIYSPVQRGIWIKIYEIYFHMKLYSFGTYMLTCQNMSIQWLTDQLFDGIGAISSEKWHNRKKTSKKDMRGKPGDGRSFRSEIVLRSILLLGLQHHPVGQVRCLQLPALLRVGHGGRGHHLEGGN